MDENVARMTYKEYTQSFSSRTDRGETTSETK
jgi:hypothetical protein